MAHKYHTINILADENEPEYAPICVASGVDGAGGFELRMKVKRGIDVPNVPREAAMVLTEAVETRYREVEKGDGRGGKRLVPFQRNRFPFNIIESYDTPKATE